MSRCTVPSPSLSYIAICLKFSPHLLLCLLQNPSISLSSVLQSHLLWDMTVKADHAICTLLDVYASTLLTTRTQIYITQNLIGMCTSTVLTFWQDHGPQFTHNPVGPGTAASLTIQPTYNALQLYMDLQSNQTMDNTFTHHRPMHHNFTHKPMNNTVTDNIIGPWSPQSLTL